MSCKMLCLKGVRGKKRFPPHSLLLFMFPLRFPVLSTLSCSLYALLLFLRFPVLSTLSCFFYALLLFLRSPALSTLSCSLYALLLSLMLSCSSYSLILFIYFSILSISKEVSGKIFMVMDLRRLKVHSLSAIEIGMIKLGLMQIDFAKLKDRLRAVFFSSSARRQASFFGASSGEKAEQAEASLLSTAWFVCRLAGSLLCSHRVDAVCVCTMVARRAAVVSII